MEGGASGGEGAAVGWLTVRPTRVTFYLLVIWFTRAKGINQRLVPATILRLNAHDQSINQSNRVRSLRTRTLSRLMTH